MIPIYDLVNHHNGDVNTENTSIHSDALRVRTNRKVKAGEEILATYDKCRDCQGVHEYWGTPEILRDFGFVEPYPHRFHFHETGVSIEIDRAEHEDGKKHYFIDWLSPRPGYDAIQIMTAHQERLQSIEETTEFQVLKRDVSDREWTILMEYRDALVTALTVAIVDAGVVSDEDIDPCDDDDEVCWDVQSLEDRYRDLDEPTNMHDEYRYVYQCETLVFGVDHYKMIDDGSSYYQQIDYYFDPETKDTCFDLDQIFQMCGSYRAHYHEMVRKILTTVSVENPLSLQICMPDLTLSFISHLTFSADSGGTQDSEVSS